MGKELETMMRMKNDNNELFACLSCFTSLTKLHTNRKRARAHVRQKGKFNERYYIHIPLMFDPNERI